MNVEKQHSHSLYQPIYIYIFCMYVIAHNISRVTPLKATCVYVLKEVSHIVFYVGEITLSVCLSVCLSPCECISLCLSVFFQMAHFFNMFHAVNGMQHKHTVVLPAKPNQSYNVCPDRPAGG